MGMKIKFFTFLFLLGTYLLQYAGYAQEVPIATKQADKKLQEIPKEENSDQKCAAIIKTYIDKIITDDLQDEQNSKLDELLISHFDLSYMKVTRALLKYRTEFGSKDDEKKVDQDIAEVKINDDAKKQLQALFSFLADKEKSEIPVKAQDALNALMTLTKDDAEYAITKGDKYIFTKLAGYMDQDKVKSDEFYTHILARFKDLFYDQKKNSGYLKKTEELLQKDATSYKDAQTKLVEHIKIKLNDLKQQSSECSSYLDYINDTLTNDDCDENCALSDYLKKINPTTQEDSFLGRILDYVKSKNLGKIQSFTRREKKEALEKASDSQDIKQPEPQPPKQTIQTDLKFTDTQLTDNQNSQSKPITDLPLIPELKFSPPSTTLNIQTTHGVKSDTLQLSPPIPTKESMSFEMDPSIIWPKETIKPPPPLPTPRLQKPEYSYEVSNIVLKEMLTNKNAMPSIEKPTVMPDPPPVEESIAKEVIKKDIRENNIREDINKEINNTKTPHRSRSVVPTDELKPEEIKIDPEKVKRAPAVVGVIEEQKPEVKQSSPLNFKLTPPPKSKISQTKKAWATRYNLPHYKHSDAKDAIPLLDSKGRKLGPKLLRDEWCNAAMQGSVIIEKDGEETVYNYATTAKTTPTGKKLNCYTRYPKTDYVRFKEANGEFGDGVKNYSLVPFRTIAVNPAMIPYGSVVFIKSAVGKKISINGKEYTHDGYFFAADTGGFKDKKDGSGKNQIDVFVGPKTNFNDFDWIKSNKKGTFDLSIINDPKIKQEMEKLHRPKE